MTPDEIIRRGQRWSLFYQEEGGLADILAGIKAAYIERMSQVEPWEADKLSKLAMANKIVDQLDAHVRAIISDGQATDHNVTHIKKLEALPYSKRRWI